jgi:hypothetical protein
MALVAIPQCERRAQNFAEHNRPAQIRKGRCADGLAIGAEPKGLRECVRGGCGCGGRWRVADQPVHYGLTLIGLGVPMATGCDDELIRA